LTLEERIKTLLADLHWALLTKDQQIEDLQKEVKKLKEEKDA